MSDWPGSVPARLVELLMPEKCDWDAFPLYKKMIEPLRARARELGYALCVHGTLRRDIDLLACPWTGEAVDARTLAEALMKVAADHNKGTAFLRPHENDGYFWAGCPGCKPHGRRVWTIHLGGGPYIDLGVMPREGDPLGRTVEEVVGTRVLAEHRGPVTSYVHGRKVTGGEDATPQK